MGTELSEEKQRARAIWDAGDFPTIAKLIASSGELAADRAKLSAEDDVLDVACGSGNATIPAARSGASVTGLDLVPSLIEAAKQNAEAAGVEIEWVVGDAENLPFEDASFDAVTSVFGVMFAPDHKRAASELARVLRPGGRMVLCNWTPEGAVGEFFKMMAGHMPPPPEGFQPPVLWGTEDHVRELFSGTGIEPSFERAVVHWEYESADAGADLFIENFGPVVTARKVLEPDGKWEAAERDIRSYYEAKAAEDGTVSYEGEYLVSTGTKDG